MRILVCAVALAGCMADSLAVNEPNELGVTRLEVARDGDDS